MTPAVTGDNTTPIKKEGGEGRGMRGNIAVLVAAQGSTGVPGLTEMLRQVSMVEGEQAGGRHGRVIDMIRTAARREAKGRQGETVSSKRYPRLRRCPIGARLPLVPLLMWPIVVGIGLAMPRMLPLRQKHAAGRGQVRNESLFPQRHKPFVSYRFLMIIIACATDKEGSGARTRSGSGGQAATAPATAVTGSNPWRRVVTDAPAKPEGSS